MKRRVVITGIGCVSPLGLRAEDLWEAVLAGRSGVRRMVGLLEAWGADQYATQIAAQALEFDPEQHLDAKLAKRTDRFAQFAIVAARQALDDAGLTLTEELAPRVGVLIGSGVGGMQTWEDQFERLLTRGVAKVSPFFVPMMIINMGAGMVSMVTGAKGPNSAVTTACASGTNAIGEAYEIVARGDAEAMIAGGAEAAILRCATAGFIRAGALSRHNEAPERACRPFDRQRDGFVMGEGSTVMVLEEREAALRRSASVYCEVAGYGMSGDAYHMTEPDPLGEGPLRAMQAALRNAGLEPSGLDYINAHAPGTVAGDRVEALALRRLLGDAAGSVMVSSTKAVHGHQLGATGATELAIAALSIGRGIVPHTLNCEEPDPACEGLDIVRDEPRQTPVRTAMSNSFGFGGHNAVVVLRQA